MQEVFKGKNESSIYTVSLFLGFGWMLLGASILVIPYTVLYGAEFGAGEVILGDSFMAGSFVPQLISYVLPIGVAIVYFWKMFKAEAIEFKNKLLNNIFTIIGWVLMIFVVNGLIGVIYEMLEITGDSANQSYIETAINSPLVYIMFFMVVFAAPIYEELIFRKFLIGFCEKTLHANRWIAFAVSSIIFAGIHVIGDPSSYIFFFQYLGLSIIITLSYTLSNNNIYIPMTVHLINNLISFIVTVAVL